MLHDLVTELSRTNMLAHEMGITTHCCIHCGASRAEAEEISCITVDSKADKYIPATRGRHLRMASLDPHSFNYYKQKGGCSI